LNVPDAVGVPERVITLFSHAAVTPAGSPVAAPMPVAPVVVNVIGVSAVLMQSVGLEDGPTAVLLAGSTMLNAKVLIQPVASVTCKV
jgi:hypothetical protein